MEPKFCNREIFEKENMIGIAVQKIALSFLKVSTRLVQNDYITLIIQQQGKAYKITVLALT